MKVVYAQADAAVPLSNGGVHVVRRGSHWSADDPVVLQHPGLFSDDPSVGLAYSTQEPPVEQATAAPGERRSARRG